MKKQWSNEAINLSSHCLIAFVSYCIYLIITIPKVPAGPTSSASVATKLVIQKKRLTINRASPIITNHIAAFFNVVNQSQYLCSSPAAVTILRPHRTTINKAIRPMIPKTQLNTHPAASTIHNPVSPSVPERLIHPDSVITWTEPNHCHVGFSTQKTKLVISPHPTQHNAISRFFIF